MPESSTNGALWSSAQPLRSTLRLLWILLNAVVGFFFAGYIAYGPFHLNLEMSLALGLAIGLLYGGLWARQPGGGDLRGHRGRQPRHPRRLL